jgi:alpha-L-fucosidase
MKVDPLSRFEQMEDGLRFSIVRAQRIYNNHKWPNPVVVKLEHVVPALEPPVIKTMENPDMFDGIVTFAAVLIGLGDADRVKIAFQYRIAPNSLNMKVSDVGWKQTETVEAKGPGKYNLEYKNLEKGRYQFRAIAIHPKIRIYGDILSIEIN